MRVKIQNEIMNYCQKPSIEEMLNYEVLTIFEATSLITRWPDYINKYYCDDIAKIKNIPRSFFYHSAPPKEHYDPLLWYFDLTTMGLDFFNTYKAIKESIDVGELSFRAEYLGMDEECGHVFQEGISYSLSPNHVIRWALLKGINLPEYIQEILSLRLMKVAVEKSTKKVKQATQNKVKNKIIGQLLKNYFPGESETFYCEHDWMKLYGTADKSVDPELRTIRNDLNELNDIKRKPGNRSQESREKEQYQPKPIKEIMCKDSSGKWCYHIPFLGFAMKTAANLLLGKFLEESLPTMELDQSEIGLKQFLDDFMKNEVVSLYTEGAPPIILEFVHSFAYWTVAGFFLLRNSSSEI